MSPQPTDAETPNAGRLTAILSKQPLPGQVKTRLCPPLQPDQAAGLAEAMLRDAIARCGSAAEAGCFRMALWYAPDSAGAWFSSAADGFALYPQKGAGLAERMAQAFHEGLSKESCQSMLMIGSDQPLVGRGTLIAAHQALEQGADLVLGPDAGGGYYAVGMRRPMPELFTKVSMSTGHMFQETQDLAASMGLDVRLLEPGYDVDLQADLERLLRDLNAWHEPQHPDFPRHTQAFLEQLPAALARLLSHG